VASFKVHPNSLFVARIRHSCTNWSKAEVINTKFACSLNYCTIHKCSFQLSGCSLVSDTYFSQGKTYMQWCFQQIGWSKIYIKTTGAQKLCATRSCILTLCTILKQTRHSQVIHNYVIKIIKCFTVKFFTRTNISLTSLSDLT